jgi:F0F1-type ATP synthase beta subunit
MKTLNTIQEFLQTNPSKEEVAKVLKVANRMNSSKLRKEVWETEKQLKKLVVVEKKLKEISIPVPNDILKGIKELKSKIETMKKDIPETKKRVKKEEEKK